MTTESQNDCGGSPEVGVFQSDTYIMTHLFKVHTNQGAKGVCC